MTGKSSLNSLSGEALFQSLRDQFKQFPDTRDPSRIEIAIEDFLMSGFAIFQLKFPSLLQFEEEIRKERNFSNLKGLFGISKVPSDTHMRSTIDEFSTDLFRPVFKNIFQKAQRAKILEDFEIFSSTYALVVDGTGYFFLIPFIARIVWRKNIKVLMKNLFIIICYAEPSSIRTRIR